MKPEQVSPSYTQLISIEWWITSVGCVEGLLDRYRSVEPLVAVWAILL
jgi:hypothetical protein